MQPVGKGETKKETKNEGERWKSVEKGKQKKTQQGTAYGGSDK